MRIIRHELRKAIGRRGSFYAALGVPLVFAIGVMVISLIYWNVAEDPDAVGGQDGLDIHFTVAFVALIMTLPVAAMMGAWDVSHGTFRYIIMTGQPRLRMYLIRIPALAILVALLSAIPIAAGIIQSLFFPNDGGDDAGIANILAFVVRCYVLIGAWGLIALGIGALFRSQGAAIAIAMGVFVAGFIAGGLVSAWREEALNIFFNFALFRILFEDETSLAGAIVSVIAWWALALGLGAVRTVRAEY